MAKTKVDCPECKVPMEDHTMPFNEIGKVYPAKKCPKCGRIMVHHATAKTMADDVRKEGDVDDAEVERIMARADKAGDWRAPQHDGDRQLLQWLVREASKYVIKSDKECPKCGGENIRITRTRKIGEDMCCDDCNIQYFYEFPE